MSRQPAKVPRPHSRSLVRRARFLLRGLLAFVAATGLLVAVGLLGDRYVPVGTPTAIRALRVEPFSESQVEDSFQTVADGSRAIAVSEASLELSLLINEDPREVVAAVTTPVAKTHYFYDEAGRLWFERTLECRVPVALAERAGALVGDVTLRPKDGAPVHARVACDRLLRSHSH